MRRSLVFVVSLLQPMLSRVRPGRGNGRRERRTAVETPRVHSRGLASLALLALLVVSPTSCLRIAGRRSPSASVTTSEMAASALASRALRPPHGRHPPAPSPRPRPRSATAAAPRTRCRAVAADERPADPAFPERQNRGISGYGRQRTNKPN